MLKLKRSLRRSGTLNICVFRCCVFGPILIFSCDTMITTIPMPPSPIPSILFTVQFTEFEKTTGLLHCMASMEKNILISYKSPTSIPLDLKTETTIAHYHCTDLQYTLCALSTNLSFSHDIDHVTQSGILVLASINCIVDNLSAQLIIELNSFFLTMQMLTVNVFYLFNNDTRFR